MAVRTCPCGSGEPRSEVHDARGIFVTFVCNACEQRKLRTYRPEIFTDPNYAADDLGDDTEL
jgi:hypothetical protein